MSKAKNLCPSCGSDKILNIREDLSKCMLCGQYIGPDGFPSKLKVFPSARQVKELASTPLEGISEVVEEKTLELHGDMITFIGRVAERLAPLTGLDQSAKLRALEVQKEIRNELTEVFQGKKDFNKWYDKTKTQFGLHSQTFMSILHDSLEGLKSTEAQELQQQYAQTLARMRA